MGAICGTTKHDIFEVTLEPTGVTAGEHTCVFMMSNAVANELLDLAIENSSTISDVAAQYLKENLDVVTADAAAKSSYKLAEAAGRRSVSRLFPEAASMLKRSNAIFLTGELAGYTAIPMAVAFIHDQIRDEKACVQLLVDVTDNRLHVNWSMVYSSANVSGKDKSLSYAHLYDRKTAKFRPDSAVRESLPLQCTASGSVKVEIPKRGIPLASPVTAGLFMN